LANQSGNELTPQTTELSSVENNYTIEQAQRVLGMRMYELSNHLGNCASPYFSLSERLGIAIP
jgi:hypothetical protein